MLNYGGAQNVAVQLELLPWLSREQGSMLATCLMPEGV